MVIVKLKTEAQIKKKNPENLSAKLQNSNQNFTFSWVSLIRLRTTRARSYAFSGIQWDVSVTFSSFWEEFRQFR